MQCPKCGSSHIRKNGKRGAKQNHICADCGRQFIDSYSQRGYEPKVKELCLKMYCNGMGFRQIERCTDVCHNTVINWVKKSAKALPKQPTIEAIPEVGELDELQTFVGKKNLIWLWTAVNHFKEGILGCVLGDRSSKTFARLWERIKGWQCYFWVTEGYEVYQKFVNSEDQIISKTYMTRVEGENTRLRHYLARLGRKTLCYSKSAEMLEYSVRLLIYYLQNRAIPEFS
jgi:Transposase and inactivated derivatives, IS1 family